MPPAILVATYGSGIFRVTEEAVQQELADRSIHSLTTDEQGRVLAVAGEHSVLRRSHAGEWTELAHSAFPLSCCVPVGDVVFVGTDDARILRVDPNGTQDVLTGFDDVTGRETWYAGTAIVDGKLMGPPLGIRSMTATSDGALLANVHVGGIPRSADAGVSWQPTIDIERDVHQVCAHPDDPNLVIAASAAGLCMSRDGGATWAIESRGLHALHCTAVAFGRSDVFISASTDQFAAHGALYRRPIVSDGPLQRQDGGLPEWLDGIVDTGGIAARDSTIAVIDGSGSLYVSHDDGASWSSLANSLPYSSGLQIV